MMQKQDRRRYIRLMPNRTFFLAVDAFLAILAVNALHSVQAKTIAPTDPLSCSVFKANPDIEISLFFGLRRPGGTPITDQEWKKFVNLEVTPRFPSGLSVMHVDGQWQDRVTGHIGEEPSRLIWISTSYRPDLADRLEKIRTAYRHAFQQQSVGLVVTRGCAAF